MSDVDRSNRQDWEPHLDAVIAAPGNHRVVFENDVLRVLEVTLLDGEEEPTHHHRWPSVFVFDQVQGPVHDLGPNGEVLPPNRDVMQAVQAWDGKGCLEQFLLASIRAGVSLRAEG